MPVKVILTLACEDDYFEFIDKGGLKCIDAKSSPYEVIVLEIQIGNEDARRIPRIFSGTQAEDKDILQESLAVLGVSSSVSNKLFYHGISRVGGLCSLTKAEVLSINGIGPHALECIRKALSGVGLSLLGDS